MAVDTVMRGVPPELADLSLRERRRRLDETNGVDDEGGPDEPAGLADVADPGPPVEVLEADVQACAVCQAPIPPGRIARRARTCGADCAAEHLRQRKAVYGATRGPRRPRPAGPAPNPVIDRPDPAAGEPDGGEWPVLLRALAVAGANITAVVVEVAGGTWELRRR